MTEQPLTLEEIHAGMLENLKKIIAICDEIRINYFLTYGSLIGAVRHHGFIPWDDDLDVLMLRPDYEAFQKYCWEHEQELYPFRLMGRENTPGYPFCINRFCDLRYRMESSGVQDAGMGMFVDIYPYDGLGNDTEKAIRKLSLKRKFYMTMVYLLQSKAPVASKRGELYVAIKKAMRMAGRLVGPDFFLDRFERLKDTYPLEGSRYVGCVVWEQVVRPMEKWHFESWEELEFEGISVKVPKDYDAILRMVYGDYMQLPPEESRVPHHEYELYRKPEFFQEENGG